MIIKYHFNKLILPLLLVLVCLSMSLGYAIITGTLSINGTLSVSSTTFDIHFANVANKSGVIPITEPTISGGTSIYFKVPLKKRGDHYEFTVDIVNDGTIDAMIDSVVSPNITEEQAKYLEFIYYYDDYGSIPSKYDELNSGDTKKLYIEARYKDFVSDDDMPLSMETINLTLTITYVPKDDHSKEITYGTKNLYELVKSLSLGKVSDLVNFNLSSQYSEANGLEEPGVYEFDNDLSLFDTFSYKAYVDFYDYADDSYFEEPIYFYRGRVDNNIIFANYCWKIVRTTNTKGVKLIYNGTPSDGKCLNTEGSSTNIGTSIFNDEETNGYTYYVGSDIDADSVIKGVIDTWYASNMTGYTNKLEDTVWCNDRAEVFDLSNVLSYQPYYYGAGIRVGYKTQKTMPTTLCPNWNDSYTVSDENGNGLLTYPVGLITADEQALAGATSKYNFDGSDKLSNEYSNTTYYLYNNDSSWTMSPIYACDYYNRFGIVYYGDAFYRDQISFTSGVRPAVSLKPNTLIGFIGDGTANNPYVVK